LILKQAVRGSYLALIALQTVWHALLPTPWGSGSWLLAGAATLPLLLPACGVWRGSLRSITWAGYLVMLYLAIGVTEAWANPGQRPPALLQIILVVVFVASVLAYSRRTDAG
jgi:uncharacterized membrane protein